MRDPDEHPPVPGKKDKKKWCGGHKGRLHDYKWIDDHYFSSFKYLDAKALVCSACGKKKDYCVGYRGFLKTCTCGLHKKEGV